jgi:hypothetical protein
MTLDPVLLSRLQWVWVISWHFILPALPARRPRRSACRRDRRLGDH